jgi:hypothetical protein
MPVDWSRYPKHWPELRELVRERDHERCRFCCVPNGARILRELADPFRWIDEDDFDVGIEADGDDYEPTHGDVVRIVLTVAHLDHDVAHNGPDNLAALCQRCHLRLDRRQHADSSARTRDRKAGQLRLGGL